MSQPENQNINVEFTEIEVRALSDWIEITFTHEEQELLAEKAPKIVPPLKSAYGKLKLARERKGGLLSGEGLK